MRAGELRYYVMPLLSHVGAYTWRVHEATGHDNASVLYVDSIGGHETWSANCRMWYTVMTVWATWNRRMEVYFRSAGLQEEVFPGR